MDRNFKNLDKSKVVCSFPFWSALFVWKTIVTMNNKLKKARNNGNRNLFSILKISSQGPVISKKSRIFFLTVPFFVPIVSTPTDGPRKHVLDADNVSDRLWDPVSFDERSKFWVSTSELPDRISVSSNGCFFSSLLH